jgi:hypothetical protein
MWRVAIACVLLVGCGAEPVDYEVTTSLGDFNTTARLVVGENLYKTHTETYVVEDYDELRDVAVSATVRHDDGREFFVVLPFAASACGSEQWMHSGELTRIEVRYMIYRSGIAYTANTDRLLCFDSEGESRTVIN